MKVTFKEGSFNHYEGDSRRYIMVAVVNSLKDKKDGEEMQNFCCIDGIEQEDGVIEGDCWKIRKTLSFGIAVCHPNDEFDLETGKKIAIEKALRNNEIRRCIAFSHNGLLDDYIVEYFLNREMQAFEKNPGAFITNYTVGKLTAERDKLLKDFKKTMTANDKAFVEVLKTAEPKHIEVLKMVANQ